METFAALAYGFLASFILSSARYNRRIQRQHSVALVRMGQLMCGVSVGAAAILAYIAIRQIA